MKKTLIGLALLMLFALPTLADEQADKVLQCFGWAVYMAPGYNIPPEDNHRIDVLGELVLRQDFTRYAYVVPMFKDQSADFWRGFMTSLTLASAAHLSHEQARDDFAKGGCEELVK